MCVGASGISTFYIDGVARSLNRTVYCWNWSTMFAKVWVEFDHLEHHSPWPRTIIEVDTAEHWSPPKIKGGGFGAGDSLTGESTYISSVNTWEETLRHAGGAWGGMLQAQHRRPEQKRGSCGSERFWRVLKGCQSCMMSRSDMAGSIRPFKMFQAWSHGGWQECLPGPKRRCFFYLFMVSKSAVMTFGLRLSNTRKCQTFKISLQPCGTLRYT